MLRVVVEKETEKCASKMHKMWYNFGMSLGLLRLLPSLTAEISRTSRLGCEQSESTNGFRNLGQDLTQADQNPGIATEFEYMGAMT